MTLTFPTPPPPFRSKSDWARMLADRLQPKPQPQPAQQLPTIAHRKES